MSSQLMDIVAAFGGMQSKDPADSEVQAQVKKLQEFITEHYYNCSKAILNQLGQMYGGRRSVYGKHQCCRRCRCRRICAESH